ncbi:unnamed protein product (mitochondrion) [Plasmodiophora brassicae]|uniref:Alginate lyase 2 domain-containing protein n=1 Tax=Plasmodiophora brassicae TaxID=37360 RepID=A0A3P3Y9R8_PLABS|nr:unnamed protein product [Plasmodiophora brassicae]
MSSRPSQRKPRVQISVVLALTAIAPLFGQVGAQNLDPRLPPSGNFNLSQFTLQLAISPIQIGYSPVGWNDSANFFTDPVDGAMSFSTPSDGNTTEGSHYPRTELRHKFDFWFDRRSTPMLSNRLEVTGRVAALSYTGRMIIGQIHGYDDGSEAVKVYWYNDPKRGGVLYASVKENLGVVSPARGRYAAPFGQQYSYSIEVDANIVTCMLNGYAETYTMNVSSWATHNVYFKAGNYLQDNSLPRTHHNTGPSNREAISTTDYRNTVYTKSTFSTADKKVYAAQSTVCATDQDAIVTTVQNSFCTADTNTNTFPTGWQNAFPHAYQENFSTADEDTFCSTV